ncbi:MAG: hypothetical protein ACI857_000901 [Arenicella sp.]
MEVERLMVNEREFSECVDKKQRMFRYIMKENREFVAYYRAGLTHLDRILFLRGANLTTMSKHSTKQLDELDFSTSHDISNRKKKQIKFVNTLEERLQNKTQELDGCYPDS